MRQTLQYTSRFIQVRGWWPRLDELARYMRSPRHVVFWYVDENIVAGVQEWGGGKNSKREARITARGWAALARNPAQPWRKRPSDSLHDRIASKIMASMKAEAAESGLHRVLPPC